MYRLLVPFFIGSVAFTGLILPYCMPWRCLPSLTDGLNKGGSENLSGAGGAPNLMVGVDRQGCVASMRFGTLRCTGHFKKDNKK